MGGKSVREWRAHNTKPDQPTSSAVKWLLSTNTHAEVASEMRRFFFIWIKRSSDLFSSHVSRLTYTLVWLAQLRIMTRKLIRQKKRCLPLILVKRQYDFRTENLCLPDSTNIVCSLYSINSNICHITKRIKIFTCTSIVLFRMIFLFLYHHIPHRLTQQQDSQGAVRSLDGDCPVVVRSKERLHLDPWNHRKNVYEWLLNSLNSNRLTTKSDT